MFDRRSFLKSAVSAAAFDPRPPDTDSGADGANPLPPVRNNRGEGGGGRSRRARGRMTSGFFCANILGRTARLGLRARAGAIAGRKKRLDEKQNDALG